MPLRIFVSYSKADSELVRIIKRQISRRGIECFDDGGIDPGDPLTETIQKNLAQCGIFIVVFSDSAMRSPWVHFELGMARGTGKRIIPYLAPGAPPRPNFLSDCKYLEDLRGLEEFLNDLAAEGHQKLLSTPRKLLPMAEATLERYVKMVPPDRIGMLGVPGEDELFSSFSPSSERFLWLQVETTPGRVPEDFNNPRGPAQRWDNEILIIRDPIRPFEIQIGRLRTRRPGGDPGVIELEGDLNLDTLKRMYPALLNPENKWMRMVLAEINPNPDTLEFIINSDEDPEVKKVAVRNPFAPNKLKRQECLFCNDAFKSARTVRNRWSDTGNTAGNAYAICNDFPYGPYFHYIVAPSDPVHSWERIEEENLVGMNLLMKELLAVGLENNGLNGSSGVRIGFNSSIRHLVMGKSTRTSAGASIEHIHKQLWGMTPGAVNLGSHLHKVCRAYQAKGTDYLQQYLEALRAAEMIVWEDPNSVLYVPFGQASIHELQIMIKRPSTNTYLDLNEREIRSLSKAEFFVTRLYQAMNINSFNEILITLPFGVEDVRNFRLILTFMTRQVDLAMSELNLLYVVDKDPFASVAELREKWQQLDPPR